MSKHKTQPVSPSAHRDGNYNSKLKTNLAQYLKGRIYVFIDAANVVYSLKDLKWKIDYKKLKKFFQKVCNLKEIYFYIAYFNDNAAIKNLIEMLSRKKFNIRSKPVKEINAVGGVIHKANCDVELAMDVMLNYQKFDTAVLLSGDSDFVPLINFLQSKGKQVIVISTRGHIARELIRAADLYCYFNLFKKDWQLKSKGSDKRNLR